MELANPLHGHPMEFLATFQAVVLNSRSHDGLISDPRQLF